MYDLVAYGAMIADAGRTDAYARALERVIAPGSVVLDIGTGPGILAFLACRAGASRVYAVEPSGVIDVAREAAAANGFAGQLRFIQAVSTAIDLPEQVDGIVSDLHGVLPLYHQSLTAILDARDRFLKPGGWMVPARETMWVAVVSSPAASALIDAWNNPYGLDFARARDRAANQPRRRQFKASELVTSPHCWATLEYLSMSQLGIGAHASLVIEGAAAAHGLAVWFDSETAAGIGFSNSPRSTEEHIFSQLFFPWPEALPLSAGDIVDVRLRADLVGDDYVWSWQTDISRDGLNGARTSYRQSSLFADLFGPAQLRKRSQSFVADLNEDARIDRRILDLMDRGITLGQIATEIQNAFPSAFKSWDAALGRVGSLSDRYSG